VSIAIINYEAKLLKVRLLGLLERGLLLLVERRNRVVVSNYLLVLRNLLA
jgi:hypothetical protein